MKRASFDQVNALEGGACMWDNGTLNSNVEVVGERVWNDEE